MKYVTEVLTLPGSGNKYYRVSESRRVTLSNYHCGSGYFKNQKVYQKCNSCGKEIASHDMCGNCGKDLGNDTLFPGHTCRIRAATGIKNCGHSLWGQEHHICSHNRDSQHAV